MMLDDTKQVVIVRVRITHKIWNVGSFVVGLLILALVAELALMFSECIKDHCDTGIAD